MDFSVSNHGSIFLLQPLTFEARAWIEEHVDPGSQEWAGAVVIEHRFIRDLVEGIFADGYTVA
jgi:hypothetical protein